MALNSKVLVVNMNTNTCRFYHYHRNTPAQLTPIRELIHSESKLKNMDLVSDKPGHYQGSAASRGAYSPHTNPKDTEIDFFAREVAKELNSERNAQDFDELILIAPSSLMGILFQHLNKHIAKMIRNRIHKDIVFMKEHELLAFLKENAQFPDKSKI